MPRCDEPRSRRVLAIWLPRWPVQRRLLERPERRDVPVFVCSRGRRGTLTVVSWAWAIPPRGASTRPDRGGGRGALIRPGMTLAEAMAVLALSHGSRACHVAVVDHDDPAADRTALVQVARWCRRFSPTCGLEAPEPPSRSVPSATAALPPECIHLDVTGTAGFFGGEAALVRTVVWTLAARGLHARVAIADTASAARAAARHTDLLPQSHAWRKPPHRRQRWAVVPPGETASMLAGLPVSALQLDRDTLALLQELGMDSIGAVLRLPADRLAARFPPQVSRYIARFLGTLAEPWERLTGRSVGSGRPCDPLEMNAADATDDELPRAVETFDMPVALDDLGEQAIIALVERLLRACVVPLAARGEGILTVQARLDGGVGRAPAVIDVGLFRPSCSITHLVDLVRLRLGRCRPPRELSAVSVEVVAAGAAVCRQRSLFTTDTAAGVGDSAESQAVAVGMLLDRLCGRLGRSAVFVPCEVADPQPEHAWVATCPMELAPVTAARVARPMRTAAGPGRRPIWMPPRPVRLDQPVRLERPGCAPPRARAEPMPSCSEPSASLLGDRPPVPTGDDPDAPPTCLWLHDRWHRVAHAYGPERIETAWWRGPTVRRDYYVVETESGERFWLFHCRRDGRWFLHGIFA